MRLEIYDGDDVVRMIGAVVIRTSPSGDICLDFGPADGPPLVSFTMNVDQGRDLSQALRGVVDGRDETVLIVEG